MLRALVPIVAPANDEIAARVRTPLVGEVLQNHVGVRDLAPVFPGFANDARKFPGLLKT